MVTPQIRIAIDINSCCHRAAMASPEGQLSPGSYRISSLRMPYIVYCSRPSTEPGQGRINAPILSPQNRAGHAGWATFTRDTQCITRKGFYATLSLFQALPGLWKALQHNAMTRLHGENV